MAPIYYSTPAEKRVPLNTRVPGSLKSEMRGIVRFWQLIAESEGHDPEDVDMTFVAERLLLVGVDGVKVQAEVFTGHRGLPGSESSWGRLKKVLKNRFK